MRKVRREGIDNKIFISLCGFKYVRLSVKDVTPDHVEMSMEGSIETIISVTKQSFELGFSLYVRVSCACVVHA